VEAVPAVEVKEGRHVRFDVALRLEVELHPAMRQRRSAQEQGGVPIGCLEAAATQIQYAGQRLGGQIDGSAPYRANELRQRSLHSTAQRCACSQNLPTPSTDIMVWKSPGQFAGAGASGLAKQPRRTAEK